MANGSKPGCLASFLLLVAVSLAPSRFTSAMIADRAPRSANKNTTSCPIPHAARTDESSSLYVQNCHKSCLLTSAGHENVASQVHHGSKYRRLKKVSLSCFEAAAKLKCVRIICRSTGRIKSFQWTGTGGFSLMDGSQKATSLTIEWSQNVCNFD